MNALRPLTRRLIPTQVRLPQLAPPRVLPALTAVLLLVNGADAGLWFAPLAAWFAIGAALPRILRTPWFWYVTASILGTAVYFSWESADNHRYLFVYWCLALCCTFSLPRSEQAPALAASSRWLVALCMLLAVAWKVVSPNYLSGSFFHYELLLDERFAHLASWTCGLSPQELAQNRELRETLILGHLDGLNLREIQLQNAPRAVMVAQFLTWWTIGIEGSLGGLFLLAAVFPQRHRLSIAAGWLLILFGVTTYAIAPVRGFGGILMLLGMAQCDSRDKGLRLAYLAAFVLIQLCTLPVVDLVRWSLAG